LSTLKQNTFNESSLEKLLWDTLEPQLLDSDMSRKKLNLNVRNCPDLGNVLLMFGLIERRENPDRLREPNQTSGFIFSRPSRFIYAYTPKIERLKYWLVHKNFLPKEIEWRLDDSDPV